MNDVMTSIDSSCSLLLKIAVAIALLCISRLCWAYARLLNKPLEPIPPVAETFGTAAVTSASQVIVAPPYTEPEVVRAPVVGAPVAGAPVFGLLIECGACGFEIKSKPLRQVSEPEPAGSEIYKCDNCKAEVAVPL